uniref:ILEI/PANDER domain-containing protein n=1 Tax=Echeneis naucrates TaxID=173247 RepID=A0A665VM69_ECHNA
HVSCKTLLDPLRTLLDPLRTPLNLQVSDGQDLIRMDQGCSSDGALIVDSASCPSDPCFSQKTCDEDSFNFYIQSGAANVLAAKICVQNKMVLGGALNNAGSGINIVILNGKTAEVIKMEHFNMYSGDVKPLIDFLTNIEKGSIVLMASFDEPSTKLNDEARKLIADLGSSQVKSLGYRDNWVFVGGKGATGYTSFEKIMKNDNAKNKYDNWPELISLDGCIPKYLE